MKNLTAYWKRSRLAVSRHCIFLVGGRRSGKTTLARELSKSTGVSILGGKNGADSVKNRETLYNLFRTSNSFILESHQVNNMTVINELLAQGFTVTLVYVKASTETRLRNQALKNGKTIMTRSQLNTQENALTFYNKASKLQGVKTALLDMDTLDLETAVEVLKGYLPR